MAPVAGAASPVIGRHQDQPVFGRVVGSPVKCQQRGADVRVEEGHLGCVLRDCRTEAVLMPNVVAIIKMHE